MTLRISPTAQLYEAVDLLYDDKVTLLHQAAAAAGYAFDTPMNRERERQHIASIGLQVLRAGHLANTCWNPLDDSGAGLRLAVRLQLRLGFDPHAYAETPAGTRFYGAHTGSDAVSRMLLAITRAAASMAAPAGHPDSDPKDA